jgi:hypothetical protein
VGRHGDRALVASSELTDDLDFPWPARPVDDLDHADVTIRLLGPDGGDQRGAERGQSALGRWIGTHNAQ